MNGCQLSLASSDAAATLPAAEMSSRRTMSGGLLALVGFILSPLSWWNDLFVNVPLALAFAWVVSLAYEPAFTVALIAGYWLTNVIGFVLMHKGIKQAVGREERQAQTPWRGLWKDALISVAYTGLIVLLVKVGVLQPFAHYFSH